MFHALPTPSSEEIAELARRTAQRLGRAFEAQGRTSPWQPAADNEPEPVTVSLEQPGLFAGYEAAARGISVSGERAGQPALRLVVGQGRGSDSPLPPHRPSAIPTAPSPWQKRSASASTPGSSSTVATAKPSDPLARAACSPRA